MYQIFNEKMDQLISAVTRDIRDQDILMNLVFAGLIALIIWIAYRLAHSKESYRPKFAVTLIILSLVSTMLMTLVQSNLALSLGMLGSLSIVRFRTNIRDPRDIGFIVWAMASGIAAATQSFWIGISGSVILAAVMICTRKSGSIYRDMLLVVRGGQGDLDRIQDIVDDIEGSRIKAKNILSDSFELVYEVKVRDEESNDIIRNIFSTGSVDSVNLLTANSMFG